jgi:hypothetical protein
MGPESRQRRICISKSNQNSIKGHSKMSRMNLLNLFSIVLLWTALASAQASRTWVSGVGDDVNPCSRTAPCKTFAGAISRTVTGGEIDALDPGGFGAVTITKAITIDGGGGQVASVLVAGTNGIVVQAGASDIVTIRNIRINGIRQDPQTTAGLNGIRFLSGKALHIESCVIFGFSQAGIDLEPSAGGQVFVLDSIVQDNGGTGLFSFPTGGTVSAIVDRSRFENNQHGVWSGNNSVFTVANSDASGNSMDGFVVQANAGTAELNIVNSTAANNGNAGIAAGGPGPSSIARINRVTLSDEPTGMLIGPGGQILSYGNNYNSAGGAPSGAASPGPQ